MYKPIKDDIKKDMYKLLKVLACYKNKFDQNKNQYVVWVFIKSLINIKSLFFLWFKLSLLLWHSSCINANRLYEHT